MPSCSGVNRPTLHPLEQLVKLAHLRHVAHDVLHVLLCSMSTPGAALAPYNQGSTDVLTPSAVSSPKTSAIMQLGEVLKTVLHKSVGVFHSENDLDAAVNIVDDFVRAMLGSADTSAVMTDAFRAAKEDVTMRTPPGGAVANVVTGPVLDYSKLAQAILAEQRKYQIENEGTPSS